MQYAWLGKEGLLEFGVGIGVQVATPEQQALDSAIWLKCAIRIPWVDVAKQCNLPLQFLSHKVVPSVERAIVPGPASDSSKDLLPGLCVYTVLSMLVYSL